jgi:hypothetical protein
MLWVSPLALLATMGCRGADEGADGGSARAPGCPATAPLQGDPCTYTSNPPLSAPYSEPQACEYGDDPHCRTVAACGPPWQVTPPDPSCRGNPIGCPSAFDAGAGAACPVPGSCTYDEGRCACVPCHLAVGVCGASCVGPDGGAASSGSQWQCEAWRTWPGCPEPRPALGSPCSVEAQGCGPPGCSCETIALDPGMTCLGGYWNTVQGGC